MAAYVPDVSSSSHHRPRRAHSHKPRPLSPHPLPLHLQDPHHRSRVRRQDHTSYPAQGHHSYRYERVPCCSPCHSTVSHFIYSPSPSLSPSPWYHSPRTSSARNTFEYSNHLHSRSYAHSFDFLDTPPVSAGRRGHQRSFDFLDSPRGSHCRRGQTTSFDFTDARCCPDYSSVRVPSRRVASHCHERRGTSVIIGGDWYEPKSHDSMSTLSTASSRATGGVAHQGPTSPLIECRATPPAVLRVKQLPTCRRPYYFKNDSIEQHISSLGHANHHGSQHEPNLNDVVDYLSHSDPSTVANAASYIQHLAYGDDNMKAKIRQFGGIPALLSQVRNPDPRVQLAVLGALRNLSYGRANNESKSQIAQDAGLPNIVYLLRNNSQPEVRELVTSVLWNLSSCEDIKLRILQCSLKDIVDTILIPSTGYGPTYPAARDFSQRTSVLHWTAEMKNSLGAIRNISSAGVEARRFLRASNNLVDTLVWIVRAAATQENVDEKTVENAICILRNLSFQIEDEVDTQQGADDDIDSQWERQIQQEIEAAKEALHPTSKKTNKSFLLFCARPQGDSSNMRRQVNYHLNTPRNLATPDSTLLPKRPQAVRGASLLWQPEIIFPYLALLEKYTSTTDLMEAAAGAIQNLTACNWKWAVYQRHLIRKANGLTLLIEHLNHAHDTVVRSVSTALRNLSIDETNKEIIGQYGIEGIIPRIPYGQNSLGISESTTISLLCTLMELCIDNYNNTSTFRDCNGITPIARLTQSKEHTPKVVYAAHKLCSIISEYKVAKSVLKQEGWDSREYLRLFSEGGHNYNFELSHAGTHHPVGGGGGAAGGGASRRSSSEEKKKKRANSDPMEITRMAAQSQQQHSLKKDSTGSIPPALSNVAPAPPTSSAPISPLHIQDLIDPTYNIIPNPKDPPTATPPSDGLPTTVPPSNPGPISMYAEINDPSIEQVRKKSLERPQSRSDSRAHSRTGSQPHSEPRSSPIDPRSTTPHEGLSSDEQGEPGNAMYAQVDYNKKRESRKRREEKYKQEEQEKVLNNGAIDSWV
ncbi:PREDICTED: armadillo repeat protein deleted in velo-cardio-facial syndrome homolog isoform X3 [Amphimedon queenslandica]|uniref:Uncharacterized protein n=1 Tax=Amphimedon queenslandica TaxID=400682 RepID=A0AAN0IVP0_AMPQE|nr:PREDICTED: armadillo repeat protein deleted in velo-cardio-facial syndrome homolog isoform X3 [Amphimedon queenslandica]|eukprot:XP_019848880.1 PREDICTED: armadillo repeat protein deleted in velo-cardio-facial syndrome homolog isoform X3 [Amphimedon queenslandica]